MDPSELYGLPLDRFIPERGAMVRALKADGRRDEAAAVAALRKPTVAAWAVNQLVRTQRKRVAKLLDAGDALREAQAALLGGSGDREALRKTGARERAAVDALVDAARGLLTSDGHELSAAVTERVAETLHAAALGEDARVLVRDGRLERELRHAGFGLDGAEVAGAPVPRPAAKRSTPKKDDRAERERASALKAARAEETAARRLAERTARAVQTAEDRHARAAQGLRDAEEALTAAREAAKAAAQAHGRAQKAARA